METSAKVNINAPQFCNLRASQGKYKCLEKFTCKYSKKNFTECECKNSLDGNNVCDATTGQCGSCRPGYLGDFCNTGK